MKMKCINTNDDNYSNCSSWLGFSLSSQINTNMEVISSNQHHHQHQQQQQQQEHDKTQVNTSPISFSTVTSSPFDSTTPHLNYGIFHGGEQHINGMLCSPIPVMPLKSDGSLCLMEVLTRSQTQEAMVTSSTPKLEDFFGGASATMGTHHYQQPNNPQNCLNHNNIPQYPYYNYSSLNVSTEPSGQIVHKMAYGDLQSLSLSMSPGSQSSCITTSSQQISPNGVDYMPIETKKGANHKSEQRNIVHRKSLDTFGQRTSQFRGVTRHRWTGRYEAHLWDNSCKKEGQSRRGRQVYLGGYDKEENAARAYDLAALKYWGPSTHINFPLENYQKELEEMKNMSRQEYVAHLRRKSSGFSRGASIYRGVTRHHQHGRWQARIGRVAGNKDLYLGTFSTQEEAAEAYDVAAIKFRGANAVTNFDISRYNVEKIMASNNLISPELARRGKEVGFPSEASSSHQNPTIPNESNKNIIATESDWKIVPYEEPPHQFGQNHQDVVQISNKTGSFSLGHDGLMSNCHTMSSSGLQDMDGPAKMGTHTHMSTDSSLVTSLNSSREGSPNRTTMNMQFGRSNSSPKFYDSSSSNVNSWIPTPAPLRQPPISMPHIPHFAAWTDP